MRLKLPVLLALLFAALPLTLAQGPAPLINDQPFVPDGRWALVIGANEYSEAIGRLRYTGKEAREFAGLLQSRLAFSRDHVRLVADGGVPEEAPTAKNIVAALDSILSDKRLDRSNLFVFYFSGHGVGTAKGDFLLPSDVEPGRETEMGVPVKEVVRRIVEAGLRNVLIIADACRAGEKNEFGFELNELCRKSNLAVILGCAPGRRSYEYASLQQGAFTHFLIDALTDVNLRDDSGALWASRVGEEVQKRVHAFTEPDYGKYAQVPAVWSERSTLDVLLAAYPKPPISDLAVQALQNAAGKLSKKSYAAALSAYATSLLRAGRYDKAVELLNTCRQMGELSPAGRFVLASALMALGRHTEASRTYAEIAQASSGVDRDMAVVLNPSALIPAPTRMAAARRVFAVDAWDYKQIAAFCADRYGDFGERLEFARKLRAVAAASPRQRSFAGAHLAFVEGKWEDAFAAANSGRALEGVSPTDEDFDDLALAAARASGDPTLLSTSLSGRTTAESWIGRAQLAKETGDTSELMRCLKLALASHPSPDEVLTTAYVAGGRISEIMPELRAAAESHPYAWQARMMLALLDLLTGDSENAIVSLGRADRYADDTVLAKMTTYRVLNSIFVESEEMGDLPAGSVRTFRQIVFSDFITDSPSFGSDAQRWECFVEMGHGAGASSRVQAILDRSFETLLKEAAIRLRPLLMIEAMNAGWHGRIEKAWNPTLFAPIERADPNWAMAGYLATRGKWREAEKSIVSLDPPSQAWQPVADGLRTYLLARNGKRSEAESRLRIEAKHATERAFQGLAWAEMGDWAKAEPLLRQQVDNPYWAHAYIAAFALRKLDEHLRNAGRIDEARTLVLEVSLLAPGSDLYREFTLAERPGTKQFSGSLSFDAQILPELGEPEAGSLAWTISSKGKMEGLFKDSSGSEKLSGVVDAYGNLKGTWSRDGKEWRISGKLAPVSLYGSMDSLRQVGQLLELIDENGRRIAVRALVTKGSERG